MFAVLVDFRSPRNSKLSKVRSELALESVLHDPGYCDDLESFCEHMIEELSVEAFLFYYAVHEYEKQQREFQTASSAVDPENGKENEIGSSEQLQRVPEDSVPTERKTDGDSSVAVEDEGAGSLPLMSRMLSMHSETYATVVQGQAAGCSLDDGEYRQMLGRTSLGIFYEFLEIDSIQQVSYFCCSMPMQQIGSFSDFTSENTTNECGLTKQCEPMVSFDLLNVAVLASVICCSFDGFA